LYEMYRLDHELFGYDPDKFMAYAKWSDSLILKTKT
jgi:hypothetical protein